MSDEIEDKLQTRVYRILCNRDGKEGQDDPRTSEAVLFKWFTEGNNYVRYHGSPAGHRLVTCHKIADIADIINSTGVVTTRTGLDVKKRIHHIDLLAFSFICSLFHAVVVARYLSRDLSLSQLVIGKSLLLCFAPDPT